MNKARSNYIYRLIGKIQNKVKRKSTDEKYQGTYFYQLNVSIENKEVKKIFAFPYALENKTVWEKVEKDDYLDKRYTFFCKNYRGYYRLIDWQELENHEQKT